MHKLLTTLRSSLLLSGLLSGGLSRGAVLIVHADSECVISIDGKTRGTLLPSKNLRLKLTPGSHHIEAIPSFGGGTWLQAVAITSSRNPQELNISLRQNYDSWIDPATNLMWTAADNGSGLSWGQALRYCTELTRDGFTDWTLPGIQQLQDLFTSASETDGFHIKGPIKLSGWQWSSSAGQQSGEGWSFDFGDGGRASVAAGVSGLYRALCVRPAKYL